MTNRPRDESEVLDKGGATSEELKQHARAVKEDLLDLGRATKDVASEKLGEAKHIAVEYYDDRPLYRCPAKIVTTEIEWAAEYLEYWPLYHKAARYPDPGEFLDQAAFYIDAMHVIDQVFHELQEREREEADRRMDALLKQHPQ